MSIAATMVMNSPFKNIIDIAVKTNLWFQYNGLSVASLRDLFIAEKNQDYFTEVYLVPIEIYLKYSYLPNRHRHYHGKLSQLCTSL